MTAIRKFDQRMRCWLGTTATFALSLAAISCAAADNSGIEEEGVVADQRPLFVSPGTLLWNDNQLGVATNINVCFAVRPRLRLDGGTECPNQSSGDVDCNGNTMIYNGTLMTNTLRTEIRREIENTWQRYGNIEFLGWGDCPIDSATNKHKESAMPHMVAIQFADSDVTSILGKSNSYPTIIQYNWAALSTGGDLFNLVHEMGHALGFDHEWVRRGFSDSRCDPAAHPEVGTVDPLYALTPWADPTSKMNYCGFHPPDISDLAPGDITGLQQAYGRKYDGSLVGYRGQCVDIQGASTADGTATVAWPCRGQWNDTFFRNNSNTSEWFQTSVNNKCLNVSGGTAPNPVISWTCGAYENERFTTVGVEWRGMGNMCVQAVSGKLQLQPCSGSSSQKWDFFHPSGSLRGDQIRLNGTTRCVSSSTTSGALGQELIMATCSSTDTKQRFNNPGKGILTLKNNTGYCANVSGGMPTAGSKIVLWDGCSSTPPFNSQFILSGKIRSLANCMQIQGAGVPGDSIRDQACDSANNTTQIWEYYL